VNIIVQALKEYDYNPYNSAKFDVVLWSSVTALDELIPVPGGGTITKSHITHLVQMERWHYRDPKSRQLLAGLELEMPMTPIVSINFMAAYQSLTLDLLITLLVVLPSL
jgi:hypothetical protein